MQCDCFISSQAKGANRTKELKKLLESLKFLNLSHATSTKPGTYGKTHILRLQSKCVTILYIFSDLLDKYWDSIACKIHISVISTGWSLVTTERLVGLVGRNKCRLGLFDKPNKCHLEITRINLIPTLKGFLS